MCHEESNFSLLLSRIEQLVGRRISRVGLSATLPDMQSAASFLRPLNANDVIVLQSKEEEQEIKLQLRGYMNAAKILNLNEAIEQKDNLDEGHDGALFEICKHLFKTLRQSRNLIFAGSRQGVEKISAVLTRCVSSTEFQANF